MGCPTLIATTGNEMDIPREQQHAAIVAGLKGIAPVAEDAGITIVLEPLNILVDHGGYYLDTSKEGFEILREVDSPRVRLLFDIYHQQITEVTSSEHHQQHRHNRPLPHGRRSGRHEPTPWDQLQRVFSAARRYSFATLSGWVAPQAATPLRSRSPGELA